MKQTLQATSDKDTKNFRRYIIGDPSVKTKIYGTLYIPLAEKSADQITVTVED